MPTPDTVIDALKKMMPDLFNDSTPTNVSTSPKVAAEPPTPHLRNYLVAVVLLIVAGGIIYKGSKESSAKTDNFYLYTAFAIIPPLIGLYMILNSNMKPTSDFFYYYSCVFIITILAIYLFYTVIDPKAVQFAKWFVIGFFIIVGILSLAIIYRIFYRIIVNSRGWTGFFLKLIFWVPCLLIDVLETLFNGLKSAPKMILTLFILEILVILGYFYFPQNLFGRKIVIPKPDMNASSISMPEIHMPSTGIIPSIHVPGISSIPSLRGVNLPNVNGVKLSSSGKPIDPKIKDIGLFPKTLSLRQKTVVFQSENLPKGQAESSGKLSENTDPIYFSISMWVYVNSHPTSHAAYAKETQIFRYGRVGAEMTAGHPTVAYFNQPDHSTQGAWRIYLSNTSSSSSSPITPNAILDLPVQMWNNIVFNYNGTTVDIFANGTLVKTAELQSIPKYDVADVIEVGDGDNTVERGGLDGSICNISYHAVPLSQFEIAGMYNINRNRDPPTNDM